MTYIKLKPLVWDGARGGTLFGCYYQILVSRTGKSWCVQFISRNNSTTLVYAKDEESAKTAAQAHHDNMVKELFE